MNQGERFEESAEITEEEWEALKVNVSAMPAEMRRLFKIAYIGEPSKPGITGLLNGK